MRYSLVKGDFFLKNSQYLIAVKLLKITLKRVTNNVERTNRLKLI